MLENIGQTQLKIHTIQKLNKTQKKQNLQNTAKQNYPGVVAYYDTQPGNKVGLFYNAPRAHMGPKLHRRKQPTDIHQDI